MSGPMNYDFPCYIVKHKKNLAKHVMLTQNYTEQGWCLFQPNFCCCDKCLDPKAAYGQKGSLWLTIPSPRKVKAETQVRPACSSTRQRWLSAGVLHRREVLQEACRLLLVRPCRVMLPSLSCTAQDHLHGTWWHSLGLAIAYSNNQANPPADMLTCQSNLSDSSPKALSQMTLGCVELTVKPEQDSIQS